MQTTISPINNKPVKQLPLLSESEVNSAVEASVKAQKSWKKVPLDERIATCERFLVELDKAKDEIAAELTQEMGRPIRYTAGEVGGAIGRAEHLISIARATLGDVPAERKDGFTRYIKKVPLGVVLVIAPWNYPYLCMINSVVPALLAGNTLLLKPSPQTPSSALRLQAAFEAAQLPSDVLQTLILSQEATVSLVADDRVDFVAFTGSVAGGKGVDRAAANGKGFKGVGLELGGKDPAYVRADADLVYTVEQLVDGVYFNSGQSCCSVERIYVHESAFDSFVDKFVELTKAYVVGDPTSTDTQLGPVISLASAKRINGQIEEAIEAGAKPLIPTDHFTTVKEGTCYVAPQVLVDVTHQMGVMKEESFGPVVGIMKVSSDEEALRLMNDSPYGLTASVWTDAKDSKSIEAFNELAEDLETGTVFLNRCDVLDPALAWTGVKDSGRGVSLSSFGFDQLTRLKSVHMKTAI